MKQQIYQNGFYTLIGLIIGALVTFSLTPKPKPQTNTIRIEMVKDSVTNVTKVAKALTEKNLKEELNKHNIPHANIVLAQAKLESANFKSDLVQSHQNIFGLKKGNKYRKYSHWTECVASYKELVSSRYKGGSYYAFLKKIGYAEDKRYVEKLKSFC